MLDQIVLIATLTVLIVGAWFLGRSLLDDDKENDAPDTKSGGGTGVKPSDSKKIMKE